MDKKTQELAIKEKLPKLIEAFCPILYEDDDIFLENMKGITLWNNLLRLLPYPVTSIHGQGNDGNHVHLLWTMPHSVQMHR